jgi:hypothetical protein
VRRGCVWWPTPHQVPAGRSGERSGSCSVVNPRRGLVARLLGHPSTERAVYLQTPRTRSLASAPRPQPGQRCTRAASTKERAATPLQGRGRAPRLPAPSSSSAFALRGSTRGSTRGRARGSFMACSQRLRGARSERRSARSARLSSRQPKLPFGPAANWLGSDAPPHPAGASHLAWVDPNVSTQNPCRPLIVATNAVREPAVAHGPSPLIVGGADVAPASDADATTKATAARTAPDARGDRRRNLDL